VVADPCPTSVAAFDISLVKEQVLGLFIEQADGGTAHSVCMTNEGSGSAVYTWGSNSHGQLGHGPAQAGTMPIPSLIRGALEHVMVRRVAAGGDRTGCVDDAGILYTWGNGAHGALAHGDLLSRCEPTRVQQLMALNIQIDRISISPGDHMCALSQCQRVFTWGKGENGRLGLLHSEHRPTGLIMAPVLGDASLPEQVQGLPMNCLDIAAGLSHTVVICQNQMWAWGHNKFGQLGVGDRKERHKGPVLVEALLSVQLTQVACGHNHTFVLSDDGCLFSCGQGSTGALGHGVLIERERITADIDVIGQGVSKDDNWHESINDRLVPAPVCASVTPLCCFVHRVKMKFYTMV